MGKFRQLFQSQQLSKLSLIKDKDCRQGGKLTTSFRRRARGGDPRHPVEEQRGRDAVARSRGAVGAECRVGCHERTRRRTFKGRRIHEWGHVSKPITVLLGYCDNGYCDKLLIVTAFHQ